MSPDYTYVYAIDVGDPTSWPERIDVEDVLANQAKGIWKVAEGKTPAFPSDEDLPSKHVEKRDEDWRIMRDIVAIRPGMFEKMPRSKLIRTAVSAHSRSRTTVKRLLLRYIHRGMAKGALLPDWTRCGAPGLERAVSSDSPKRGCPVVYGEQQGLNVTIEIRRLFDLAHNRHYVVNRKLTLSDAYHLCVRMFFCSKVEDPETGRTEHLPLEQYERTGFPSLAQFIYWGAKDNNLCVSERRRATPRIHDMRTRALLGTATAEAFGPCSRFLIDATVLDVYVRSRRAGQKVIGRPTLYVVIDVFSRMIVGIYIGLESPSWIAAMMALANCVADKVAFRARFGIVIRPDEWLSQNIPGIVEGDRGEMEGAKTDHVLQQFNIQVENAAAYRPDWKAIVEKRFHTLQAAFRPYVHGYVETDFRERGARDYRADAVLDLDEITAVVSHLVLYYNNSHEIQEYPRHPRMTEDGVASVPVELFKWGVANLSGVPRTPDEDRFRFALMPRSEAAVTKHGLVFEGRYYACDLAGAKGWYERARKYGTFNVPISYDKRDTTAIYVHDPASQSGFSLGRLTDRSLDCAGLTAWEAEALRLEYARLSADRRQAQLLARADADGAIEAINSKAEARNKKVARGSIRSQVEGIRESRAAELAADRIEEAEAFRPKPDEPASRQPAAEVIAFKRHAQDTDRARPSLMSRLARPKE